MRPAIVMLAVAVALVCLGGFILSNTVLASCPTIDFDKDYDDDPYPYDFLDLNPYLEGQVIEAARRAIDNPNITMPMGEIMGFRATMQYTPSVSRDDVATERSDGSWYYKTVELRFRYTDGTVRYGEDGYSTVKVWLRERPWLGCHVQDAHTPYQIPRFRQIP